MWQYLFDPAVHWGEHEGEAESQGSVCGRVEEWPRFHEGDEDGEDGHKGDVQAIDNTAGLGAVAKGGTPTYPDGVDRLTKLLDRVKETKSAAAVGLLIRTIRKSINETSLNLKPRCLPFSTSESWSRWLPKPVLHMSLQLVPIYVVSKKTSRNPKTLCLTKTW